jgi:hypothetical protein
LIPEAEQVKLRDSLKRCCGGSAPVTLCNFPALKVVRGIAAALLVACLILSAAAQDNPSQTTGLPEDWSHHHLVFSQPTTVSQSAEIQKDLRYLHQLLRRNMLRAIQSPASPDTLETDFQAPSPGPGRQKAPKFKRDWAVSFTGTTTATTGTVGDEQFPAKYTFDVNAPPSCANDFVVYNTGLVQSSSQPSIVAFNQLYSTQGSVGGFCNQNGPSVMWAYRAGTTGTTSSGPILSLDGTKVAFVENIAGAPAVLHILKWKSGEGTLATPVVPDQTLAANAAWSTCVSTNSCVANLTFSGTGNPQDTISSPFYRYDGSDTLYVGDSTGHLQKFTGVFSGTPTVVSTGGWPVLVDSGATLTSPVYDGVSKNIFVGDSAGQLSFVLETGSTTGACGSGSPPCLGSVTQALGGAIVDGPLVDSSAQTVFAFEGTDTTNDGTAYQFNTQLANASKRSASIGAQSGHTGSHIHMGTFDNLYYTTGTGHLFVCGKTPPLNGTSFNDRPAIHRISITSGVMNTVSDGDLTLAFASNEECSPVSEFNIGTTDRIFFSVANNNNPCAGSGGCVMSLVLTGTWPPTAVTNALDASGGTSGIVVDNSNPDTWKANTAYALNTLIIDKNGNTEKCTTAGTSGATEPTWNVTVGGTTHDGSTLVWTNEGISQAASIYFTWLSAATSGTFGIPCNTATNGGCAVKLTQAGFQ